MAHEAGEQREHAWKTRAFWMDLAVFVVVGLIVVFAMTTIWNGLFGELA